jgi:hypothetical protein
MSTIHSSPIHVIHFLQIGKTVANMRKTATDPTVREREREREREGNVRKRERETERRREGGRGSVRENVREPMVVIYCVMRCPHVRGSWFINGNSSQRRRHKEEERRREREA